MFIRNALSLGIFAATLAVACSSTTQQTALTPVNPAQAKLYCSGVSDRAATADVLARPGLVEGVSEYRVEERQGHNTVSHLQGARIMLRPEPGMSRPMLGRALQCRMAEKPPTVADNYIDPLSAGHPDVQVAETDTGYMVIVSSRKEDVAREIMRRANNLLARSIAQSKSTADAPKVSAR